MSLSQQAENLIDEAPLDLQPAIVALTPALVEAAQGLKNLQYFVGSGSSGQWIASTLQHRQSGQEIKVVYCFAQVADLQTFYQEPMLAVELPLLDLLFQLTALPDIEQLVFYDSADFAQGRQVKRADLQAAIERHLSTPPPQTC
jgi:hypothetical protein